MWDSINKYRKVQQRRGLLLLAGILIMIITTVPVVVLFQEEAAPPACCYRASIVVCASDNCGACGCDYTCDGTDDEAEINDAIQDLVTCGTGGDVMLTEGTFDIDASIVLDSSITLRGSGAGTVITWSGALTGTNAIKADTESFVVVRDLMLDGDDANGYGIYFDTVSDSLVENVWAKDTIGGVYFDTVVRTKVLNSWIYSTVGSGFTADSCDRVELNGCQIYDNSQQGGYFLASTNCALEGNILKNNAGSYGGLYFTAASDYNGIVRNIVYLSTGGPGVQIYNSSHCEVANNEIYLNGTHGIFITTLVGNSIGNLVTANLVYQNSQLADNTYHNIAVTQGFMGTTRDTMITDNHSYADTSTANRPANCVYVGSGTNAMIHGNMAMNRPRPAQDMSIAASLVHDNTGVDGALAIEWLGETSPIASPTQNYKIWTMDSVVYFYSQYIDVHFGSQEEVVKFSEEVIRRGYWWDIDWTPGLGENSVRVVVPDYWMSLSTFLKYLSETTGVNPKDLTKNMGNYIKPSDAAWQQAGLRRDVSALNGRVGTAEVAYYYLEHPDKYPYTTQDIKDYIDMTGWKSMEVAP